MSMCPYCAGLGVHQPDTPYQRPCTYCKGTGTALATQSLTKSLQETTVPAKGGHQHDTDT